jgi:arylsulfatase A-like enzyme
MRYDNAMNRRQFLGASALGPTLARAAAPARKPNIIFVLADDLGYGDLGCYGQRQIQTPHLDRMAAEGMRFTQAYAGSTVCAPSRCCLITGLHSGHALLRGNRADLPLRPGDVTVQEVLKEAGYHTGLIGKWSLGLLGSTGYPTRKGFDYWYGYFSQSHAHNYYPEHLLENDRAVHLRGNTGTQRKEYAHDLFTDRALEFVERNAARPYFLHLAYAIPHANNELGRDTGDGMEVPSYEPYESRPWPKPAKGFAAMITRMDRDIGRLFDMLKKTGQDENTIVIFSSDNGPHREGGHEPEMFQSSGPLRGIKRDLYEGGIRVPTIARWPGRIKAGQVSDHQWAFWDFLPTAAELAGTRSPAGLDGRSFVPALMGRPQKQPDCLYWEFHERGFTQAVRTGDWKGVRHGRKAPVELYDLAKDIGERNDIAAKHPEVAQRIARLMDTSRTESEHFPVQERPPQKKKG